MPHRKQEKRIVFIPARGGSKSIPLKNIKLFCGKPLIHWIIEAADQSDKIDKIVVSTDNEEIKGKALEYSSAKLKMFARSPASATDEASTEMALIEYLDADQTLAGNDIIILAQLTSPWTLSRHFDEALKIFEENNYDSMLSVIATHAFQWNAQGAPLNYDYLNRPRRQNMERVFQENGAFYINSVDNIRKNNNRLSGRIGLYPMHKYSGLELDENEDWLLAENMMKIYLKEMF